MLFNSSALMVPLEEQNYTPISEAKKAQIKVMSEKAFKNSRLAFPMCVFVCKFFQILWFHDHPKHCWEHHSL